ncbi:hypothetical protein BV20DRAFT_485864 [Pilatotrama ljubarskyi]|nr:hypothetical protein BV20DRAFT_485864 [Pilatotrama ljubarskyi]
MSDDISELHLTVQERIQLAITKLPTLSNAEIPLQESCPICLNSFDVIVEGKAIDEAGAEAPEPGELAGVTKLVACGHIFCRACLVEWIRGRHGSCPSCRNVFSSIRPPSDSDVESSDGDYVPGDDEEDDEEDGFFDSDGFMDTESVFDDMDIEEDVDVDADVDINEDVDGDLWEDNAADAGVDNWGLSDGDGSESMSEVEVLALSAELQPENDDAEVYSDGAEASGSLQAPEDDTAERK